LAGADQLSTKKTLENASRFIGFVHGQVVTAKVKHRLTKSMVAMWIEILEKSIQELKKL
jgi:hypothetical protein